MAKEYAERVIFESAQQIRIFRDVEECISEDGMRSRDDWSRPSDLGEVAFAADGEASSTEAFPSRALLTDFDLTRYFVSAPFDIVVKSRKRSIF